MEIGQIMQVIDFGIVLEAIDKREDGSTVFKQLPVGIKVDPAKVAVCFASMLKPIAEEG